MANTSSSPKSPAILPGLAIGAIPPRPTRGPLRWIARSILLLAGVAVGCFYSLDFANVPPRLLAPYILKRVQGHEQVIVDVGNRLAGELMDLDRGVPAPLQSAPSALTRFRIGAQHNSTPASTPQPSARAVSVDSAAAVRDAIARAEPGDVITMAPGRYRFDGSYIGVSRPGTQANPITVRATQPGTVTLDFAMVEGFLVNAPYWRFENLTIVGICSAHSDCEHAFHVVGNAHHFVAHNNTIMDFNSHFKINGQGGAFPDDGTLEANTLTNNSVRKTSNPVDVIDLVSANNWKIQKNLITDFFKGDGNRTSYAGFAKGGGSNNLFENNIVFCEYRLRNPGAITVGLSLGGGGTGAAFCRDKRCVTEQSDSTIRGNLIAACSDDGIYINKAAMSKIIHNTMIDTAGISVRFPSSSAVIEGNLIDGKIRLRDEALIRATDNVETSFIRLYAGSHPVRQSLDNPANALASGVMQRRSADAGNATFPDLCGTVPNGPRAYGAFDVFVDCLAPAKSASKDAAGG